MNEAEPGYLPATDMPRFLREMMEFVSLGEADLAAIRRSAPIVLRDAEHLTEALYEHFLRFPRSARFFLREDGTVDVERLERRKHSLTRWLRETAQAVATQEFSYYLLTVGISHSHRARGPGGTIPPHLMIGAMSLAQSALASLLEAELEGPEAAAASVAWNKLLLVNLSALLLSYLPPRPLP
ncbi:MAG: protoglobin family protein [Candidatus Rokuibacteriota bacterium]